MSVMTNEIKCYICMNPCIFITPRLPVLCVCDECVSPVLRSDGLKHTLISFYYFNILFDFKQVLA